MTEQMHIHTSPTGDTVLSKSVAIDAPTSKIWEALTNPVIMKKWMSEPETEIDILTDWRVGNPVVIRGKLHGIKFENKGKVLEFEPEKILQYSHLSSLSRLPDRPESYSVFDFRLAPRENLTVLTLTLSNFPTESIYKHLAFYWNVTLEIFKRKIEEPG
jgi:uncharacterized protein YndB with AHSA1/START domain